MHLTPTIIYQQLGGQRFLTMTGAYSLTGSPDTLAMRVPKCKNGCGAVRITLDANDTYTVVAIALRKKQGLKTPVEVYRESNVYCDQLEETFTEATGLYTRL